MPAAVSPKVHEVAQRIETHLRSSGYSPGDRYLDARQLSLLLNESEMMAQRAMRLLAGRGILERRPKAGTFITRAFRAHPGEIRFFLPEELLAEEHQLTQIMEIVRGMRLSLPEHPIQLTFLPNRSIALARQSLEQPERLAGVALVVSSREMRACFHQSGVPTVVFGAVEPDLNQLCSIEYDQRQLGRLLASRLLEKGHRRIATLMREIWGMGDQTLHDAIAETLGAKDLPAHALLIRCAPNDVDAIRQTLCTLFLENAAPPTALICRTAFQLQIVQSWVREHGIAVALALCNPPESRLSAGILTARRSLTSLQMGEIGGQMLADLIAGKSPKERHCLIPLSLNRSPAGLKAGSEKLVQSAGRLPG